MPFVPDPDTVHTELTDDESVLLNLQTKQYYMLNETGRVIWTAFSHGAKIDEIVAQLVKRYDVRAKEARKHVNEFLAALKENGLAREL